MADAVADQPEPDLRGPLRYLCWLARCQLGRVLLGAGYGSAWMVTLALPPYLLQEAIDEGLRPGDTAALWGWAGALLGVGIVNAWLAIGRHRTMSMVRIDANFRTTRLTVEHVTRLGAELPRRVSAGEVVTIGLGDVTTIATALTVAGPGVGAVIAYAVVGFLLWTVSWLLAVVVLLGVPMLAPYIQAVKEVSGQYLFAGGFPNSPRSQPVPPELFQRLATKNLVFYHWEITAERVSAMLQPSQGSYPSLPTMRLGSRR